MRAHFARLHEAYWVVPAFCVAATGVLALVAVRVDEHLTSTGWGFTFGGGPESARSLLSTISTSMLSLTALVFSITIVVLQLASSQFSPRALPTFLRDRQNQLTLGVFLATYVYALLALREVRNQDSSGGEFVPALTIGIAVGLVMVSIGFFVAFIHHIATSIQVGSVLQRIQGQTLAAIDRDHPDAYSPAAAEPAEPAPNRPGRVVAAASAGTFAGVKVAQLVSLAQERDVVVRLLVRPGDFVPQGLPLLTVEGATTDDDGDWLAAVEQVDKRDDYDDVALGLRQILDVAGRALSPGINDDSTAVQCLDRLHDVLRRLGNRGYPAMQHRDSEGRLRLLTPQVTWQDHVAMVVDEMRLWGSDSLQVRARMTSVVQDLLQAVPPARREPLEQRLPLFRDPLPVG